MLLYLNIMSPQNAPVYFLPDFLSLSESRQRVSLTHDGTWLCLNDRPEDRPFVQEALGYIFLIQVKTIFTSSQMVLINYMMLLVLAITDPDT